MTNKLDFEITIKKIGTLYNADTATDRVFKLANQLADERLKAWIEKEKSLSALGITACGTDEKSAYVHRLYHYRFNEKLKDLNQEKPQ